ncbi:hypothetical protein [Geminocystis herdmanii]|uniref:hypothetical protein n=1 Tax=Geminocystis herdmanii TaxID=669359 RepID=UPI00034A9D07|nr:hypothetical protein [Geminocystis herdmanii]
MFRHISNFIGLFFRKSRNINNEPVNKVSLTVIIIIDLFILFNVFAGLDDISRWHLSPSQAYSCYSSWQRYNEDTRLDHEVALRDRDFHIVSETLNQRLDIPENPEENYRGKLGKVSEICLNFNNIKNQVNQPNNQAIFTKIQNNITQVKSLQEKNRNIRSQYDSTLLEKIAGQPSNLSINQIQAQQARQELEKNDLTITNLTKEIAQLKQQLITTAESTNFIKFLNSESEFQQVKKGYESANFWYPTIQIFLQFLFLIPLITIALFIHNFALEKGYGLMALMSWHLLVIFFIPLLIKIFEFLQVGIIFEFLVDIITVIFGGLLFLISYIYILLIPVIGFGIIKFFQQVVFNPKSQASKRIEKSRCLNCGKKINNNHQHCPHCGYYQYIECANCHNLTYKLMPYCYHCGSPQN